MPMPLSGLAQTLSNSVANVQAQIVDTQDQLASGVKTLNPGQAGVVTRLSAQATGYDQTLTNIGSAQSVISVAQASLTSIAQILTQMQALANQASSASLTANDRNSLNATFANLASQVTSLGTSSSVNGNNLLGGTQGITVTTGIDGSASANTTISSVDVPTLATTVGKLLVNSTFTAPTDTTTAQTFQKISFTPTGTAAATTDTIVIGGLTFTAGAIGCTVAHALSDIANFINGTSSTGSYGTFSGSTVAQMQAIYSGATISGSSLVLTQAAAGVQTALTTNATGGFTNVTPSTTTAYTAQKEAIDFTAASVNLPAGQAVTVDGLTYTAASTASVTATHIADDFAAFISTGQAGQYGTFSGSSYATMSAKYATAQSSGGTLTLKYTASGVQTSPVIKDPGASNAAAAVASLTTQLQTISTGQSTLSAASTGLTAQASANTALKTGLTNTVNSIQNIDATAMQAKLQQLNNQQSIDYYLVSQMNTEAAAILSIFR